MCYYTFLLVDSGNVACATGKSRNKNTKVKVEIYNIGPKIYIFFFR